MIRQIEITQPGEGEAYRFKSSVLVDDISYYEPASGSADRKTSLGSGRGSSRGYKALIYLRSRKEPLEVMESYAELKQLLHREQP